MARNVTVTLDAGGLAKLCKSPEMQAAVGKQAESMCAKANSHARQNVGRVHIRGGAFEKDPYRAKTKVGRWTAMGIVETATAVGAMNEAKNKSLMRQNH